MDLKLTILLAVGITIIGYTGCAGEDQPFTDYQLIGLNEHNDLRQRHNSPPLQLDPRLNELADSCAKYYTKKHILDHSCLTGLDGHGENIYVEWGNPNPDINEMVKKAVRYWYDEVQNYNYPEPGASSGNFGHFTQSVWRSSGFLGIGVAYQDDYVTVVAKYNPHGNILGDDWELFKENVLPPV
ncbi:unnamed protein product [Allacma fusca]|uniref:SCP domain-containing protein n=1 Tax=Allacma fusca TaxID=39272 RepID=A0A8J2LG83_9HEXA|nr:unnamed protein product [Allacma fusca]